MDAAHGRILVVGEPLEARPGWRILVRPLGICVVTETSYLSMVTAAINLGSIEKEFYWQTTDTKQLIEYLGVLKTAIADNLHMFNQSIIEKPDKIRNSADLCIRNAKKETVV